MPEIKMKALRQIQAETSKTFGNPKRLLILETIWDRELSNRDLAEITGLDKVTLAQQTAFMSRRGIISARNTSEGLVFAIADPKILKAFQLMRQTVIDKIKKDSELLAVVTEEHAGKESI